MINNKKLIYEMKHGKIKHYQPYKKTTKITDVMKQTDKILNSYNPENNLSDAQGLQRAYDANNGLYVSGNKLYISGTFGKNGLRDIWDDITKITFGLTKYSERYQDAEEVIKNNPNIKFLKGHSLGGSVALSLNENYNGRFSTTTYGAPVFNLKKTYGDDIRFRSAFDPTSIFDMSSITTNDHTLNPLTAHSYNSSFHDEGKEEGHDITYKIM